jgi:dihydrofolate reductase
MPRLIYSVICSLDGYSADEHGRFDWAVPDEEVIAFLNEQSSGVTTYLYGRRMYETMTVWETDPDAAAISPESGVFAQIWQRARKVVFSTTLNEVRTTRTTVERELTADVVARIKAEADGDLYIDGPTLAGGALRLGLVDEIHLILVPAIVGGGLAVLPARLRLDLTLLDERRFGNGMMHLRYAVGGTSASYD